MKNQLSLGKLVSCIYRYTQTYLSKELAPYSIGSGQFSFLLFLNREEGVTQDHIARILHVDKATATRALNKLEKEGYIQRQKDPADKRRYNIYLTDAGRKIYPVLKEISFRWTELLLKDFSEKEKDQFFAMISRVMENASSRGCSDG
ncbi:MAG: MarR family transcriptional regulator [Theionarchaea archaeon]|nr:MarR family transcriptional regulator [Theionarchaea archaeon]